MNKIFKVLTLVLIMTLCIGVIFTFVGCKDDKPENELQSISVIIGEGDEKLVLSVDNANEDAIRSAISVTASFSGKDIAETIEQYEIVGFDANAEGEQTVTIKYNGFEQSIKVVINRPQAPTLSSIKIDKASIVLSESEATEAVLKSKIEVKAVYSDGSETVISDYSIEGFKADAEDEQTVTIKYSTISATIKVIVEHPVLPQEPTLESIKVAPDSLTIAEADASVDAIKGKIVVIAVYSDKSEKTVSDYTVEGFDADAEGEQNVTIKYLTVSAVVKVTIERPTEPEQIKIYVNTDTEGKVLNESPSGDANVVKQYSITIVLDNGDLVIIKAGKIKYNNYDKICGFKGVASLGGEYTFYVKIYQDGTHSIWVDKPISTDPEPYKVNLIVNNGDPKAMTIFESDDANVTVQYTITVPLKKDDKVTIKDSDDFTFVNYEEEYTSFRGTATIDGEYTFYVKKYKDGTHSIWVGVPASSDPNPDVPVTGDTITIYYYNVKGWSNVNAYAWVNGTEGKGWPGQPMTAVEGHDNWYQAEVSSEKNRILFNAGDQMPQTLNLVIDTNKLYYNGYEWTDGYNVYDGPLSRTIYYYNTNKWSAVNAYAWDEFEGSENRFSDWPGTLMTAVADHDGWYSIEIGIEYKSIIFNDGSNQTGNLSINDAEKLYYYNEGWVSGFGESIDPTPNPDVPKITENSEVYIVVGETKTKLDINNGRDDDVLEFMIEKIALDANSTFTITVDGKEYANYKDASPFKGSVEEAGKYSIYVSNEGIYVAIYTAPTPTVPTLTENSKVILTIKSGEESKDYNLNRNESSLSGGIEFMIENVAITANDVIVIKIEDVEITNYKNELVKDGHVSEDGKYNFYVDKDGIWVEKVEESTVNPDPTPDIPQEPTLESIKINVEKLTIDKEDASLDTVKQRITVTAVYSDASEKEITDYTIDGSLDLDSIENQTLTISYQGKTATLVVLITERQVPVEPTKYYVYLNNNPTEMVENEETDKTDGRLAEYIATVDLGIGDTITIKDSLGNAYETFENFSGKAVWTGNHTVYLKLYSEGHSIWVGTPQVILDNQTVVKILIDNDIRALSLNTDKTDGIEYKIENVAVTTENIIKILVGEVETANYKNSLVVNGKVTENGNYNFYVADDGIWVEKVNESTVDPDTPYSVSIIVNNDEPIVMSESESDANVTAQYTVTVTLKEGDVVKIIDSTSFVFVNYEDTTSFKGVAASDGEYTFYAKKYKDGGDSIWVAVPVSVDPTPDVPVTSDTITVYYYNVKGWSNVNAYAWVNNDTNNAWPGETMAAVEGQDGWYSIEVSTSYTSIIFNAGNGGEQTRDIAIVADKYYFNGYEWTDGYNTQEKRIVYFKNTAGWSTVNAYSWNDSNNNKNWPGQAMTKVDGHDGWYMIELSSEYDRIIFNNGSTQTDNINYYVGSTYYDYSKSMWVESF